MSCKQCHELELENIKLRGEVRMLQAQLAAANDQVKMARAAGAAEGKNEAQAEHLRDSQRHITILASMVQHKPL